jgi:hypothetical protein
MDPIVLFLRYEGSPSPLEHAPGVLKVSLSAASCSITTEIGAKSVKSAYKKIDGGKAQAETVLTLTGEGVFIESGTIKFGDGSTWLKFNTVGQGFLGAAAAKDVSAGCAVWKITEGGGQFAGATGHVTGNFIVDAKGVAYDNQVAVIFPKKGRGK